MTELICIVCPRGCHLTVTKGLNAPSFEVSGAGCKRGVEYGRAELTNPLRVLTSTVPISGAALHHRCPVKTKGPIPKALIFLAMQEVRKLRLTSPVSAGQVLVKDLCGTGVELISTRAL